MNGSETIRALRRIKPDIKIIVASGSASGALATEEIEAGTRHFLAKPHTAGTLLKILRNVLDEDVKLPAN